MKCFRILVCTLEFSDKSSLIVLVLGVSLKLHLKERKDGVVHFPVTDSKNAW